MGDFNGRLWRKRCLAAAVLCCLGLVTMGEFYAAAQTHVRGLYPGLEPLPQCKAFKQYLLRTRSDFSKLLYLIERLGGAKAQVIYDGYHYDVRFAATIARWFLFRYYKGQNTDQWIRQWCHRTVPGNNLIWVKFPDGDTRLSSEILTDELMALDEIVQEMNSPSNVAEA